MRLIEGADGLLQAPIALIADEIAGGDQLDPQTVRIGKRKEAPLIVANTSAVGQIVTAREVEDTPNAR